MKESFTKLRDISNIRKLEVITETDLPDYCNEFFIGIENRTTTLTRLNYAYDLRLFFGFLVEKISRFKHKKPTEITLVDLETLSPFEIEQYLNYLSSYSDKNKKAITNESRGKSRKLSAIRTLIKYFIKKNVLKIDPTTSVDTPKIKEKEIIRLENDEIQKLLDVVDTGEGLSKHQLAYYENTKIRDTAIIAILLGTGIRVSELVGINLEDVDFENFSFLVTRKGGNRVILYFSEEVAGMLYDYYLLRKNKKNIDTNAFFLSLQNKRISTRAVENLVKKYSQITTPLKKISPHKLRSTFGTNLYKETNDIYVVADVLGHKDVNTTKKHYAAITEDIRKNASTMVKLRRDDDNN